MDGGNPGAVSRDGTKKYQAKLGLVKDDKSIKCFLISAFISHKVQKHKLLQYEYEKLPYALFVLTNNTPTHLALSL